MRIVGKCLTKKQFEEYVDGYNFGTIPPNTLVLHHTWRPEEDDCDGVVEPGEWNGKASILGLKAYYEKVKKWQTGPHIFIADDGIWLFTPMYDTGVHAGDGNATYKNRFTGKLFNGYIGEKGSGNAWWKLQSYSLGIEVVGDYDNKLPDGKTLDNTMFVLQTLMRKLNIKKGRLKFHRDYSTKTCPGAAVTKEWVYKQLDEYGKPKPTITSVPPYFTELFKWDPSSPFTREEFFEKLYRYHTVFIDKPKL